MKKVLLFSTLLTLTSSQIFAISFNGARVKNETGKQIDEKGNFIKYADGRKEVNENGVKIKAYIKYVPDKTAIEEISNGQAADIKTDKSNRKICWEVGNNTYETQKTYSYPDTITITDNGEKYNMTSGIGGLDKDYGQIAKQTSGSKSDKKNSSTFKKTQKQIDIEKLETEIAVINKAIAVIKNEKVSLARETRLLLKNAEKLAKQKELDKLKTSK